MESEKNKSAAPAKKAAQPAKPASAKSDKGAAAAKRPAAEATAPGRSAKAAARTAEDRVAAEATKAAMRAADDADKAGRDYFEALAQATTAVVKGYEALGHEWMSFTKDTLEDGVKASQALMACRSIEQAIEVHSEFVASTVDKCVVESGRLSELSLKMADDAMRPMGKGVTAAFARRDA